MFRLALRNVFRHKLRTLLTLLAITTGVAALILSGGFVQDMFDQLAEATIHSQLGHLQIYRTGYYERGSREPEKYLISDIDKIKLRAGQVREIEDIMARLNFSGLINNGRADYAIIGEGVEPAPEARLGSSLSIRAGRQLTSTDRFGILLGEGVAKAQNLKPGDRTTLVLNTPQGALNSLDFDVVGVFRSFSKDYDDRAVRITLASAQALLDVRGANAIVVSLKKKEDTNPARTTLNRLLLPEQYDIRAWNEIADFYKKTIELYKRQFGVLQIIILAMVVLSVVNSVSMSTFERIGEFGTMMALGDRGTIIFRLVMTENILLGLIGSFIGVVLGLLLALAISSAGIAMPPPPNMNQGYIAQIRLTAYLIGNSFAIGVIATVLAALLPARRVSRIPVIDALRQN